MELNRLADRLHHGQLDLLGVPYVEHVRAVATAAKQAAGDSGWAVGLLHDAVEDGKTTFAELREFLDEDELIAVGLLTRPKGLPYKRYINVIADAPGPAGVLARAVKIADLKHNLGRMTDRLRAEKPALAARYADALITLDSERLES